MSASITPETDSTPPRRQCQITGEELPADDVIELFGFDVGAMGKAILIDRLATRQPLEPESNEPVSMTIGQRIMSVICDAVAIAAFAIAASFFLSIIILMVGMAELGLNPAMVWATLAIIPPAYFVWVGANRPFTLVNIITADGELASRSCILARSIAATGWIPVLAVGPIAIQYFVKDNNSKMLFLKVLQLGVFVIVAIDWIPLLFTKPARTLHDIFTRTYIQTPIAKWTHTLDVGWSGVWEKTTYKCPVCSKPVTASHRGPKIGATEPAHEQVACPHRCRWKGTTYLFRPTPIDIPVAAPAVPDESICIAHSERRAVAVCSASGDYCCSLCAVEVEGKVFSAGYLKAHPQETDKLWPLIPKGQESFIGFEKFVSVMLDKNVKEHRLYHDKIDSVLVWKTPGMARWRIYVGPLLVVAGITSLMWGGGFPCVFIVIGLLMLAGSRATKSGLMIRRGADEITIASRDAEPVFDAKIASLTRAICAEQKRLALVWLETHPDDAAANDPERSLLARTAEAGVTSTESPMRGTP